MRIVNIVALTMLSVLFLWGCVSYMPELEALEERADIKEVTVRFDLRGQGITRSTISPDEEAINDLNLYAFCDGKLISSQYFEQDNKLELKLLFGHRYNLYALANMGKVVAPVDEEEFIRTCCYRITDHYDMDQFLPMSWSYEGFVVDS